MQTIEEGWQQRLAEISERVAGSPFYRWLGLRVQTVERGHAQIHLPAPRSADQWQGSQRDALFAAADAAAALAVLTLCREGDDVATVEARLQYLAPLNGEGAVADALVQRKGHRLSVVQVTVVREDGVVAARGQLTCAIGAATAGEVALPVAVS